MSYFAHYILYTLYASYNNYFGYMFLFPHKLLWHCYCLHGTHNLGRKAYTQPTSSSKALEEGKAQFIVPGEGRKKGFKKWY